MTPDRPRQPFSPLLQAAKGCARGPAAVELHRVYRRLPLTTCDRHGLCCGLLPPLLPVEMLCYLGEMPRREPGQAAGEAAALTAHFLGNAARRLPCPWARSGSCAIYDRRFFACRAYGLWSPAAYHERRRAAEQGAAAVVAAWRRMGVELPAQVLAPGPEYCRRLALAGGDDVDDDGLEALEQRLGGLGADLPVREELAGFGGDLSFLVAALSLGPEQALKAKVEFTKAVLAGREEQAAGMMEEARRRARAWAAEWAGA